MVEGAPLLRVYAPKGHRGFESLSLRKNSLLSQAFFFERNQYIIYIIYTVKKIFLILTVAVSFAVPAYLAKCAADAGTQNDMAIPQHSHDSHAGHSHDAEEEQPLDADEESVEAYDGEEQISEEEPLSEESETGYVQE